MKFPEQKKDLPGAREVKNSLVIDGTFDKAFQQIVNMPTETGNLDAVHAILGQLVHDAVDRAFEAAQGQAGSVQALRRAFITTSVEGSSNPAVKPRSQLHLKFESVELLDQAADELNWMLRQDVTHEVAVGEVYANEGKPALNFFPTFGLLPTGTKLYADKRGVIQERQLVLPEPDARLTWDGDGQFGDYKVDSRGSAFYGEGTVRKLLALRASWDFVSQSILTPMQFMGAVHGYDNLPVPQSCKEGDAYLVTDAFNPSGRLFRNTGSAWANMRGGADATRGTMVDKWLIVQGVPIYKVFTKYEDLPLASTLVHGLACLVRDEATGTETVYMVDKADIGDHRWRLYVQDPQPVSMERQANTYASDGAMPDPKDYSVGPIYTFRDSQLRNQRQYVVVEEDGRREWAELARRG